MLCVFAVRGLHDYFSRGARAPKEGLYNIEYKRKIRFRISLGSKIPAARAVFRCYFDVFGITEPIDRRRQNPITQMDCGDKKFTEKNDQRSSACVYVQSDCVILLQSRFYSVPSIFPDQK